MSISSLKKTKLPNPTLLLNQLPLDLVKETISYLIEEDTYTSLLRLNKHFNRVFTTQLSSINRLYLEKTALLTSEALNFVRQTRSRFEQREISIIELLYSSNPSLKVYSSQNPNGQEIVALSGRCCRLERLAIFSCAALKDQDMEQVKNLPLTKLHLSNLPFSTELLNDFFHFFPSLTSLTLYYAHLATDETLQSITFAGGLKTLRLNDLPLVTSQGVDQCIALLPNLTRLHLGAIDISNRTLEIASIHLTYLTSLTLLNCEEISKLSAFSLNNLHLTRLVTKNCPKIRTASYLAFAKKNPKIKILKVEDVDLSLVAKKVSRFYQIATLYSKGDAISLRRASEIYRSLPYKQKRQIEKTETMLAPAPSSGESPFRDSLVRALQQQLRSANLYG